MVVSASCTLLGPYFVMTVNGDGFDLDHNAAVLHQRGSDIFAQRAISGPVLDGVAHWTLAAVYPEDGRIVQYDSKGSHSERVGMRLALWLEGEARRRGRTLRRRPSEVYMDGTSPQQGHANNDDCRIFVVHTAQLLCDDVPLSFDVSIMPRLRSRLTFDLLRGRIERVALFT